MSLRGLMALAAALTLAAPAWANYNINAKLVCYDDGGSGKLLKLKGTNKDIIAMCLGVPVTDPTVANYALTFDSDFRELHVISRCDDSVIVCDLSTQLGCKTATTDDDHGFSNNAGCVYQILDAGKTDVQGLLTCVEKEKYSLSTNKYTFSTSCIGSLDAGGTPCTLSFKSNRLFEESDSCP